MRKIKLGCSVFWISLGVYQSLGFVDLFENVFEGKLYVICLYKDPWTSYLRRKGVNVFSLEEEIGHSLLPHNSGHLLSHPKVLEYIKSHSLKREAAIAYFKPSPKIDRIVEKFGWLRIGNSSRLNKMLEDKLSFWQLFKAQGLPLIKRRVVPSQKLKKVADKIGFPLVISKRRGWAGKGSFLLRTNQELLELKGKLGESRVLVSPFIEGITLINNACVLPSGKVVASPPAVQISGVKHLSSNPLSSCGRQWPAELDEKKEEEIKNLTQRVGELMWEKGYRGYFGLDFILEKHTGKIYLVECNPRLTASFVFYNYLESKAGTFPLLAQHVLSFIKERVDLDSLSRFWSRRSLSSSSGNLSNIKGGEVIQRNIYSQSLLIPEELKSGFYNHKGRFVSDNPFLEKRGVGVVYTTRGHPIKKEEEVFRIIAHHQVFNTQNKSLSRKVQKLREKIIGRIL